MKRLRIAEVHWQRLTGRKVKIPTELFKCELCILGQLARDLGIDTTGDYEE